MKFQPAKFPAILLFLCSGLALTFSSPIQTAVQAQQPTGSIPTVTGTPSGAIVSLYLDITLEYVYSGPSSYLYPPIGVLIAGQEVPAFGYSEDGDWIQIQYPGVPNSVAWVYAPLVQVVKSGRLPVIPAPPTPTPASTPTINPTLAAAFIDPVTPTRLPTFTPPAPFVVEVFTDQSETPNAPAGLLIIGLGFIGALGVIVSFLRGR